MKKVLFVDTVHPMLWEELEKEGFHCIEAYGLSKEEVKAISSDTYGIVIRSRFKIDAPFLDACQELRFIARAGSGMENIDEEFATSKGIACLNAPEGNRQAVAEHALGMLLSLFNTLNTADLEVRQGLWKREENRGIELSGKTVGIIGYGHNGSAFADVLSGFGVKLLAYDKYKSNYSEKAIESDMQTIFNEADILSLHIPLTDETRHLVNDEFIQRFKKPFYLINTSRGQCVKTTDLLDAMQDGKVLGACLDVLEDEKTSFEKLENSVDFQRLIQSKKVILSPHVAGWTKESKLKLAQVLLEKIKSIK
jgi:D-3-phosphoglycerate dehydrogenase